MDFDREWEASIAIIDARVTTPRPGRGACASLGTRTGLCCSSLLDLAVLLSVRTHCGGYSGEWASAGGAACW